MALDMGSKAEVQKQDGEENHSGEEMLKVQSPDLIEVLCSKVFLPVLKARHFLSRQMLN